MVVVDAGWLTMGIALSYVMVRRMREREKAEDDVKRIELMNGRTDAMEYKQPSADGLLLRHATHTMNK